MDAIVYKRDTCRLCASRDLEMALHLQPSAIADAYVTREHLAGPQPAFPLDLHLCRECGHVQLLDVVNPDLLFRNYTYVTSVSLGLVKHFQLYAESLMAEESLSAGDFVVEIGSNDGSFLRFLQEKGIRVLGIDPAVEIAQRASESGVETLPHFVTSELARGLRQERGAASVVVANNVFAHADDLGDMLDAVRELLADQGVFKFEVSYLPDIVDRFLFDTIYHEHLSYHTVKPLDTFCRRHGMELIDVEFMATKGGSIRVAAQPKGAHRSRKAIVDELIAQEEKRGFDRSEIYREFERHIQERKTDLWRVLQSIAEEGGVVAGYGASATVTTLLHHFELGQILQCLFDDNPRKQGTFSPGQHIPVLSSDQIYEMQPHSIVILAWNYATPIMNRHGAFLERDGQFVVPLPRLEIIRQES